MASQMAKVEGEKIQVNGMIEVRAYIHNLPHNDLLSNNRDKYKEILNTNKKPLLELPQNISYYKLSN